MNGSQIIFLAIVFLVAAGVAVAALLVFSPLALRERLTEVVEPTGAAPDNVATGWVEKVAHVAQPFSRLSLPEEGWEKSPLRTRFMNAGWRSASRRRCILPPRRCSRWPCRPSLRWAAPWR